MFHVIVTVMAFLLVLSGNAINLNLKRIADALSRQNEYYGIFEQTSEEQETAGA
jgi:hypothetical protein